MTEQDRKEILMMMEAMRINLTKDNQECGWRIGVKAVADVANNMLDDCMTIVRKFHRRKQQYYTDAPDQIWTYYIPGYNNPCGCGSNCYHYELDGNQVFGVCNSCGQDIYVIDDNEKDAYLSQGIWKECEEEK